MASVLALAVLLLIYAAGELIAQKTKAVLSSVLVIAILLLIGFWSGLVPTTIIDDAQVSGFGTVIAGLLIVSLGTTIDFQELKQQWKVVITALLCVCGAVLLIVLAGGPLIGTQMALSGAPIFAGGSAATLIMTEALKEKGLTTAATFCIALYVTQKFIGVPIASLLLRRTALRLREDAALVAQYSQTERSVQKQEGKRGLLQLPRSFERPSVYLAKLGLVAAVAHLISELTGGVIHYYVVCLVVGAIALALGFLEKNIMAKTQASGLVNFLVTILIFSNLANTTPGDIVQVVLPLLFTAVAGVVGVLVVGFLCSRMLDLPLGLAVSLGISCTFGFPTTMLIPQEVAEAMGRTEAEKAAILNYLLPKMLTAGFITVTIASVILAGVAVRFL